MGYMPIIKKVCSFKYFFQGGFFEGYVYSSPDKGRLGGVGNCGIRKFIIQDS